MNLLLSELPSERQLQRNGGNFHFMSTVYLIHLNIGPSGVEGNYCSPRGLCLPQPPLFQHLPLSLPQQPQQGGYYAGSCRESKCAVK